MWCICYFTYESQSTKAHVYFFVFQIWVMMIHSGSACWWITTRHGNILVSSFWTLMDIYFIYEICNVTWSNVSERWELLPREHSMWSTAERGRCADRLPQQERCGIHQKTLVGQVFIWSLFLTYWSVQKLNYIKYFCLILILLIWLMFVWNPMSVFVIATGGHCAPLCQICMFCLCKSMLIHFIGSSGQKLLMCI